MLVGERTDPYLNFRFKIEIESLVVGGFSEVSGLEVQVETEDYREGGLNDYPHKLVGGVKYANLVLKRGLTDADALWKWQRSVGQPGSKIDRKTVRIILLDQEGQEKSSWRCLCAYPAKWAASNLKGDANTVAMETLELVHCGIERG